VNNIQIQEVVDQIMQGPLVCFTVFVEYRNGTNDFYTFSTEEGQLEYSDYVQCNNNLGQVARIVLGESSMDCRDDDDWLFTVH
jgi:hypothetical protein